MVNLPDKKSSQDRVTVLEDSLNRLSLQNKQIVDQINKLTLERDIYLNIINYHDMINPV